jgi:hypothetical protein
MLGNATSSELSVALLMSKKGRARIGSPLELAK